MSYANIGGSNKNTYDCCNYSQQLQQSVDPLKFQMYFGKHENCNKCIDKKVWFKQDPQLVNIESELLNITRPLSNCDAYKFNPNYNSTYDPNNPVILSPSLCPIVFNNIPKQTSVGYSLPSQDICPNNSNTDVNNVKQFNNQMNIDGTNNVYSFINACDNKPLYNGSMEKVRGYSNNSYASI